MGHFLKKKCVDSRVNVHILASNVKFSTYSQETDYSELPLIIKTSFMKKTTEKNSRHVMCFKLCTLPASVMREMFGKGPSSSPSPSPSASAATPPISRLGRVATPSNTRLGRVATPSSSRLGRVATVGVAARPPSRYSWPLWQLEEAKGSLCSPEGCVHLASYKCWVLKRPEVSDSCSERG
jgi:hypothetical protein